MAASMAERMVGHLVAPKAAQKAAYSVVPKADYLAA